MTPYEQVLWGAVRRDERIVVMTAENRAFLRNVPEELKHRLIDVGICEQNMIATAAGLAMSGKKVLAHALATFLTMRPYEMIRTSVAFRNLDVTLVGAFGGLLSEANGYAHQAIEDVALMRSMPNVRVVSPACGEEMPAALANVLTVGGPCYLRYNHVPWEGSLAAMAPHEAASDAAAGGEVAALARAGAWAAPRTLRAGNDGCLLVHGLLVRYAVEAADKLAESGVNLSVVYMPQVLPLQTEGLVDVCKGKRLIVIEDHRRDGGLFDAVCQAGLGASRCHVGVADLGFAPGLLADVLEYERLNGGGLASRIKALLDLEDGNV